MITLSGKEGFLEAGAYFRQNGRNDWDDGGSGGSCILGRAETVPKDSKLYELSHLKINRAAHIVWGQCGVSVGSMVIRKYSISMHEHQRLCPAYTTIRPDRRK